MQWRYIHNSYTASPGILRDIESRGPWAVVSEHSEDTTKGPEGFYRA